MSSISTESTGPDNTSEPTGGNTLKDLKTDFANLLINRVTMGECLNVIRDACVARASDLIDEADPPTLENIKKDIEAFKTSATSTPNEATSTPNEATSSDPEVPESFENLAPLPNSAESTGPEPNASP